jgi:cellobiose-specific phosphotransferase system component IIA
MNRRAMFEAIASEGNARLPTSASADSALSESWSKNIENIIVEAERHLIHAEAKQDRLIEQIQRMENAPPTASARSVRFWTSD